MRYWSGDYLRIEGLVVNYVPNYYGTFNNALTMSDAVQQSYMFAVYQC